MSKSFRLGSACVYFKGHNITRKNNASSFLTFIYRLQCFPITIPSDDKRFVPNGCMEFIRSTPTVRDKCKPNG